MILENIVVGSYMVNCYLTGDSDTKEIIIIDPGFNPEQIIDAIEGKGFTPVGIVLTHGHGDHIGAVEELIAKYEVPLYIHKFDDELIKGGASSFTKMMFGRDIILKADKFLSEGDIVTAGKMEYKVLHTPGHTPGGICLVCEDAIFSGDTLFRGSIGRTDFPGGSYDQIINSIKTKLLDYPDETKVYPGHNSSSTIGYEKKNNPFLR
ncbi:Glyoxylase, beta-lactamase superfamily II [Dethiosulfatibacter aminovorans DSM 17477]|uniref:Glyoxylase, beta-lactamase superfamily II n=1 Tax=Dethiosulfatibacter aminovorans DSM 17477 TaxID=1121476 RepID=A0A1M6D4F8_9FIRM|nr:MBL fold metallo-hydrolase [Dethiosulfatibacter aminovorans]SHI68130.1 Glyoxylase, beta-lactamase superfamily II [Dethiosulfatibacter aminovorans DSM 17477]